MNRWKLIKGFLTLILIFILLFSNTIYPNIDDNTQDTSKTNVYVNNTHNIVSGAQDGDSDYMGEIVFSDDFEDGVIDSNIWSVRGNGITEADGVLCILRDTTDDAIRPVDSFSGYFEIELRILLEQINWQDMLHGISLLDSEGIGISFGFSKYGKFYRAITRSDGVSLDYGSAFRMHNWYQWKLVKVGNRVYIYVDSEQEFSLDLSHTKDDLIISLPGLYEDGNGPDEVGTGTKSCIDYFTVISKAFTQPAAQFSADMPNIPIGIPVNFIDHSTGPPTYWSWDFGDGRRSIQQNPSHIYHSLGSYTVSLTVTNPKGEDTETKINYINVNPLVNEVWVDDDYTPDGFNDGHTWGYKAFAKIQNGIDAVTSSGTVYVSAGVYTPLQQGGYQGNILIQNKNNITLQGSGASMTMILGDHSTCAIWVIASSNIVIRGFTITNGGQLNYDEGGGIHVFRSNLTVENCIITKNEAANGGGVKGEPHSTVTIVNSVITHNRAGNNVGAVLSDGLIMSSTIVNNIGGGVGGEIEGLVVTNSIIWGNGNNILPVNIWNPPNPPTPTIVTYSNIEDGYPGEGNIAADPMFVDASSGDYHLQADSPCIDAGTNERAPIEDIEGNSRPFDGDGDDTATVDIGAYEYTPLITTTWTTTPQTNETATTTMTPETSPFFIPGFNPLELLLALSCLVVIVRRKSKMRINSKMINKMK